MTLRRLLLLFLSLPAAGCRVDPPHAATPPLTALPTLALPTLAAAATPILPTAEARSPLFGSPWRDRAPYRAGLLPDEQAVLDGLPDAPIYHIDVTVADDLLTLSGRQAVRYTNQTGAPLDAVYFRLFPNISDGRLDVADLRVDGRPIAAAFSLEESALRVALPAALDPGAAVIITGDLTVVVPQEQGGNWGAFRYRDGILALAGFFPIIPVFDDEGWNLEIPDSDGDSTYTESAFFLVRVTAAADVTIAASGAAVAQTAADGRQTVTYAAGPMRDFTLVLGRDLDHLQTEVGGVTVRSYAPPAFAEAADHVLTTAADALAFFSDRYGPYPFTELDVVSTPNDALGIEYPGLVVIALRAYDPAGDIAQEVLTSVVVHEVAHQWFYSLVGNDQLDEPWLDEAVTQYATWTYFRERYGPAGDADFRAGLEVRQDRAAAELPIGRPVAAYGPGEYSAAVYGRGPLVLDALAQEMGRAPFDDFLRAYVAAYRYDIASADDFIALAETTCACPLASQFKRALYGDR